METKNNQGFLEKVFHLSENHTDVKTEVIAGITTFMTMAYILAVNPNILSDAGMDRGAVFTATALASLVATLLMAAFANYPFVLAPGMGLNAYFAYTVVLQMGYTWQMALAAVFVEGLIDPLLPYKTKKREEKYTQLLYKILQEEGSMDKAVKKTAKILSEMNTPEGEEEEIFGRYGLNDKV